MTVELMTTLTADVDEVQAKEKEGDILGLHISLGGVVYDKQRNLSDVELLLKAMESGNKPRTSPIKIGSFQ